jgi:hypothetical protein
MLEKGVVAPAVRGVIWMPLPLVSVEVKNAIAMVTVVVPLIGPAVTLRFSVNS